MTSMRSSFLSSSIFSSSFLNSILKYGLLGVGVISIFYFTSSRKLKSKKLTKEEVIEILKEISESFHSIFSDLAQMTSNVMRSMKAKGLDKSFPQEQLEIMLLQQGFQSRMKNAENKILASHNCDSVDLESASNQFADEKDVKKYKASIEAMYNDAVNGVLPLCVDITLDEKLTKEKVCQITTDIHVLKQQKYKEIFQNMDSIQSQSIIIPDIGPMPSPSLSKKLQSANDEAEKEIIEKYKSICPNVRTFQHAVALFSRDEEFLRQKNLIEELHSDMIINIMQQTSSSNKDSDTTVIAAIHQKLEETTNEELFYRLESTEDTFGLVCVLVFEPKKNELKSLNEFTDAIDRISTPDCCFVYMTTEEAIKSQTADLKKVGENPSKHCPVYMVFAGKSLQFSSKNVKDMEIFLETFDVKKKEKNSGKKKNEQKENVTKRKMESAKNEIVMKVQTPVSDETDKCNAQTTVAHTDQKAENLKVESSKSRAAKNGNINEEK